MSNTKDILIKLKDATINQALPLNDLPVEDIKEAIKAEKKPLLKITCMIHLKLLKVLHFVL